MQIVGLFIPKFNYWTPIDPCIFRLTSTIGPLMVWTVPKVRREYFGFKTIAPLPTTYPSKCTVRTYRSCLWLPSWHSCF
jgi:hypothetical protein